MSRLATLDPSGDLSCLRVTHNESHKNWQLENQRPGKTDANSGGGSIPGLSFLKETI
jgi:hypothetical protein